MMKMKRYIVILLLVLIVSLGYDMIREDFQANCEWIPRIENMNQRVEVCDGVPTV